MRALILLSAFVFGCGCQSKAQPASDVAQPPGSARSSSESGELDAGPIDAPRPVAPASTSRVVARRPRFRARVPPGYSAAVAELCRARACDSVSRTIPLQNGEGVPSDDLAPGPWFWRVRASGTAGKPGVSAVWVFVLRARVQTSRSSFHFGTDINGDGVADVLLGSFGYFALGATSGGYAIGRVDASGACASAQVRSYDSQWGPAPCEGFGPVTGVGDVDGDGFGDLLARTPDGDFQLFRGSADGHPRASIIVHGCPKGVAATLVPVDDLDGDGFADIIVRCGPSIRFLRGNADGHLVESTSIPKLAEDLFAIGDFNGDGFADTVDGVALRLGPDLSSEVVIPARASASRVELRLGSGDMNGDGFADVASCSHSASQVADRKLELLVHLGRQARPELPALRVAWQMPKSAQMAKAAPVGDLDGDGFDDFAVGAPFLNSRTMQIVRGGRSGLALSPLVCDRCDGLWFGTPRTVGDVNGDGFDDVLVDAADDHGDPHVFLYQGGAKGLSPSPAVEWSPPKQQ